jgi:quinol monooxygenase YgiN
MSTEPLIVVAAFQARPGAAAALLPLLSAMLPPTRAETGCRRYDLQRSVDDPDVFFFDEEWATIDDHRRHLDTAHVRQLLDDTRELLDGPIRQYKGTPVAE